MAETIQPIKPAILQTAAAAALGAALGLACLFGLLPAAGLIAFLAATALVLVFRKLYRFAVAVGIALLACVFIEPSPSDAVLAACIPLGLITGAYRPKALGAASAPAALLLCYFVASLPGVAEASDTGGAVRYWLITFYLFLLALFVATYASRDSVVWLLRAYIAAAFLSLAAGAAGLLGLFPDVLMMDAHRVKGLFKDANVFGPFFVPAVVLLLADRKEKRLLKAPGWLHVAGAALLSLGVVVSYSRAAWINLAVAVIVFLALGVRVIRPSRIAAAALIAVLALGGAACVLLSPALRDTQAVSFILERAKFQNYDNERFGSQRGGLTLIAENPMGVGPGQFEKNIAAVTGMQLSPHSLYVRTAAENGIAGFVLFFSALGFILLQLLRAHLDVRRTTQATIYEPKPPGPLAAEAGVEGVSPVALLAILAGLLVNSAVVDTLHWRHFWFFIGIALYAVKESRRKVATHV